MERQVKELSADQGKDRSKIEKNEIYCNMSDDTDDLKSIKVYKLHNTKEGLYDFALKFRVIPDLRGYNDIFEGTATPPGE